VTVKIKAQNQNFANSNYFLIYNTFTYFIDCFKIPPNELIANVIFPCLVYNIINVKVVYPGRMKNETTGLLALQQLCP
jgi:hypothetical protein